MKKTFLIIYALLLLQNSIVISQNLVPNPSFELDTACPNSYSQIYFAPPWFQPDICYGNTTNSSTTDLFNICDSLGTEGIPNNEMGYQMPRTGIGYAGIIVYADTNNYHEYLEVPLLYPLTANRNYCVEFYVSVASIAISDIGAYFSVDSLLDTTYRHTINYVTPQIENPIQNMLNDTINWMLVSGNFIAAGGEKFMTIGNFQLPANTNLGNVCICSSYYFIDDVSVIDCTGVGIEEKNIEDMVEVYPNPATSSITLTLSKGEGIVALYNVLGECVLTTSIVNHKKEIDISFLPKGVYFVNVKSETQSMNRKFVKE